MGSSSHNPPLFLSLGMIVLDEIHLPGGQVLQDVLGGSCAYSTLGACLATSKGQVQNIACFILGGNDFPADAQKQIASWGVDLEIQRAVQRETTRGKLQYHDEGFASKTFGYMTPPLQPTARDLPERFLGASAFHLLASPEQLENQVNDLLRLRKRAGMLDRPLLVWEPAPMFCRPNSLAAHVEAAKLVDVFSPNHLELDALCGRLKPSEKSDVGREHIEQCAAAFMEDHADVFRPEQLCVIRCGEHGSLVARRIGGRQGQDVVNMSWVDPFYSPDEKGRVKDATGAGNAFLGALAVELQQNNGDPIAATVKASVAVSFAVEQVGLPTHTGDAASSSSSDLWNGTTLDDRMEEYERRTG